MAPQPDPDHVEHKKKVNLTYVFTLPELPPTLKENPNTDLSFPAMLLALSAKMFVSTASICHIDGSETDLSNRKMILPLPSSRRRRSPTS
jgi:hypothetical protein